MCKMLHIRSNIMKDTVGVIKEIDNLGRIVIPKEMRNRFSLDKSVEVVLTKDGVLLRNPEYELIKVKVSISESKKDI